MKRLARKSLCTRLLMLALGLLALPAAVLAADGDDVFPAMLNPPASTAISGGGTIPEGRAITAWNYSYRSKYESVEGVDQKNNKNSDNTTFINLLKLRYGLTDRTEIQAAIPYTLYDPMGSRNLDSWGDIAVGPAYSPWLERLGDFMSVTGGLKIGLPTGGMGPTALPGGGAWSGTASLGATKTFGLHQLSSDLWYTVPFTAGNTDLRKGDNSGATFKYAYALTKYLAIGVESVFDHTDNGSRNGDKVLNGYSEWYGGPAVTFNIPGTPIDLCFGTYLPIYREYKQNTSSDSVRFDGKFFVFW